MIDKITRTFVLFLGIILVITLLFIPINNLPIIPALFPESTHQDSLLMLFSQNIEIIYLLTPLVVIFGVLLALINRW